MDVGKLPAIIHTILFPAHLKQVGDSRVHLAVQHLRFPVLRNEMIGMVAVTGSGTGAQFLSHRDVHSRTGTTDMQLSFTIGNVTQTVVIPVFS